MWTESKLYREDLETIVLDDTIPWDILKGTDVLVTGATGLIGSALVNALLYANQIRKLGCRVHALVRNREKAECLFAKQKKADLGLLIVEQDVLSLNQYEKNIDYIIHGASLTSSKSFVEEPVETIETAIQGTTNLLKLAREKKTKSFVYLSTMEVYGTPTTDEPITEEHGTNLDTMHIRNSYPISKRMCENLCACYAMEFQVNTKVVRLTQTFGAGADYQDGRVFAEFVRCAVERHDIVLHTAGKTKRSYLYTADAVRAVLVVLLCGERANVYNVANEKSYCSIYEMAQLVAKECAKGEIQVRCEVEKDLNRYGYMPELHMNLDTTKLKRLGWKPEYDLPEMFKRLYETFEIQAELGGKAGE